MIETYDRRSLGITFAVCTAATLAVVIVFYLMWAAIH